MEFNQDKQKNNAHFEDDDIDSLYNANLDKELLDNHFINRQTKEEALK